MASLFWRFRVRSHFTAMTELSSAAQAVLDVTYNTFDLQDSFSLRKTVAAALRAAADQSENLYDPHEGKVSVVRVEHLIAIANELETQ